MKSGNVKLLGVSAVVVAVILLFSWIYLGHEERSPFEGDWQWSLEGSTDELRGEEAPQNLVITADGEILTVSFDGSTEHYVQISDREAVSVEDGASRQLYIEDGYLYRIHIVSDKLGGMAYGVYRLDGSNELPPSHDDVAGMTAQVSGYSDGLSPEGQFDMGIEVVGVEESVAEVKLTTGGLNGTITGFAKVDGDRVVITGYLYMAPGALYTIVLDPEGSYITGYGVNGGVLAASDGCLDGLATSGSKVVRSHLTGSADTVEMAYQGGVFTSGDDRMVVTGMLDGWVLSDPLSTGNASATFVPATGSADFVVYSV